MSLKVETHAAKSGSADSLVVFIHGYGADGNDLIGLAEPMSNELPNTTFISPHAPNICTMNPMGKEWFPIPMIDMTSEEFAHEIMLKSVAQFQAWLDAQMVAHGVTPDRVVLVGFSQGTMLALHAGPRRTDMLACIVGFSGRLLAPESLEDEMQTKPPILLIHGDMDMVVPATDMAKASDAMTRAGFEVLTHISSGMAHGIAPDGLGLSVQFIKKHLGE